MENTLNSSQKLFSEYKPGDSVLIAPPYELEQFFSYYGGPTSAVDLNKIGNQIGIITRIPSRKELDSWDGKLPVLIPSGEEIYLPFAALGEATGYSPGIVEEPVNTDTDDHVEVIRDQDSEYNLVANIAAETIQETYRRYRDCKAAKKLKKVSSTEKLVMDMAADTIRAGIIRSNKKRRKRAERAGRPPLSVSSLDQQSLSTTTTSTSGLIRRDFSMDNIAGGESREKNNADGSSDPEDMMEKLVEGEKAESVELSPRFVNWFDTSPRKYDACKTISPKNLSFRITEAKSENLKSVKWNGNNDPYVVVSVDDWASETEVIWNASEHCCWPDLNIVGKCTSSSSREISLKVFNANLIRDDQLIGVGSVSVDKMVLDEAHDVNVDIYEEGGKERFRGIIVLTIEVKDEEMEITSHSNSHHQGKREKKLAEADRHLSVLSNGASDQKLETSNNPNKKKVVVPRIEEKKNASPQSSRKSFETKKSIDNFGLNSRTASGATLLDNAPETNNKDSASISGQSIKKSKNNSQKPPPPESTSSFDINKPVESNNNLQTQTQTRSNEKVKKSNFNGIESKKQKPTKKKDKKKTKKSNSKDMYRVVDKAFDLAFTEECSAIRLSTYETALVLDALGIELSAPVADFVSTGASDDISDDMSFRSSRSAVSCNRDSVFLSLQSEAVLAGTLSDFIRDKGIVKQNLKTSRPFSLTEEQASIALKHLVSLIKGDWKGCRKLILSAATSDGVNSLEDNKPEYWGPYWICKLLSLLQMPPLDLNKSTGEEIINMTDKFIRASIKPSILRCRCRLYSRVICLLDEWWSIGQKPNDVIGIEDVIVSDSKMPLQKTRNVDNKRLFDGADVRIAKSDILLRAMMPVHRAYAWSATIEDMAYFCELVGGRNAKTMKHGPFGSKLSEAHGMKWVTFSEDTMVAHSNISVLSSLREFGDDVEFVSGRCVYIPKRCLKKVTAPIIENAEKYPQTIVQHPVSNLVHYREVKVGMKVRVLDFDSLCRAFERFDWWERPAASTLHSIAGKTGEIVSNPTPTGKDYVRYGVSVTTKNGEIVDALPPDALEDATMQPLPQKTTEAPSQASEECDEGKRKPIKHVVNMTAENLKRRAALTRHDSAFTDATDDYDRPHAEDKNIEPEDFDPGGGDENVPLSVEDMEDEEIERMIRQDSRIKELEDEVEEVIRKTRPLYRPVTPSSINVNDFKKFSSGIPRGEATEIFSETNNFGWMKREDAPEVSTASRPKSATAPRKSPSNGPQLSFQVAQLDLDNSPSRSKSNQKNAEHFMHLAGKSRARAEKEAIKRQRKQYDREVEENIRFWDGENIDFCVEALDFNAPNTRDAHVASGNNKESPKRSTKRPSSANKALKGSRPRFSQGNNLFSHPKPPQSNGDRDFLIQSSKHHVPSPADDVHYQSERNKAFLQRELKRNELESKPKEKFLEKQLKQLGVTVQDLDLS